MNVRLGGRFHLFRPNLADVGRLNEATTEREFQWTGPLTYIGGAVVCTFVIGYGVHLWRQTRRQCQRRSLEQVMAAVRDADAPKLQHTLKSEFTDVNQTIDGELPLIVAVHIGEPPIVAHLLQEGAKPNATVSGDTTALMAACTLGRAEIVALLLKAGADPLLTDEAGFNAAHMAARMGHLDCLREVVTAAPLTADDKRISDGASPLMLAAAENHIHIVRWLGSRRGVDVNASMTSGITALMAAAKDDHHQTISALIDMGSDLNQSTADGRTALSIAVQHNAKRAVDVLLRNQAKFNTALGDVNSQQEDRRPIVIAARKGHCEMLTMLVASGCNADTILADGRSLLLAAVDGWSGTSKKHAQPFVRISVVETLLDLGADPHFLSQEMASDSRRDSYVVRRTPYAAARASENPELIAAFDDRLRVLGGEPA